MANENALLMGEGEDNFFHDGSGDYAQIEAYVALQEQFAKLENKINTEKKLRL